MSYPALVKKLLDELQKLPGIGAKTAERLVFHILKSPEREVMALADAIRLVKERVKKCRHCFNITDQDPCAICSDSRRDQSTICVVEQPKDLLALEKTGSYQGLYHVLMGHLAPLDNIHAENLTIEHLLKRVKRSLNSQHPVKEVILATNPNLEGDTTALYLYDLLKQYPIQVTKIARGIPSGASIEFANQQILAEALSERRSLAEK